MQASNPFADLIPQKGQSNPFADLVPQKDDGFSFGEMVGNIPGSAAQVGKDIWNAVRHPVDTAQAIGQVAQSLGNKLGRNAAEFVQGQEMEPMPEHSEAAADAVGSALKNRYGSIDALKNTIEQDPVGFAVDVSGVGSASRIPGVARVARAVDPINAAARTVQTASKVIPKDFAAKLYDSAAKFSTTLSPEQRSRMVQTALEQGIVPTKSGVRKVSDRVDLLDAQLDDLIEASGKSGQRIPVDVIYQHLNELRKSKGGFRIDAPSDLKAIDQIQAEFQKYLDDLGKQIGGRITAVTPKALQGFKRDAYKSINWDRKNKAGTPIKEDTYKSMARGAKDAIAQAIPEASEINKLLGELLELQPHLTRAANRIDNRNLIGLDTSVKTGAGIAGGAAIDATGLGAGLGLALSMLGNPKVKPRIAIALKRLRDGDVNWIDAHIGDPSVRAALTLAGRANEIVSASSSDAE